MTEELQIVKNHGPLRLISIAWGESYVRSFLELCLPAVLAPGNLPVLTEHFDVELVLVTETAFFTQVRCHPAWQAAMCICRTRLISLDDLITANRGSYGMTITYTFFRGFEDLGSAMTDCYLVFIHADFILADGSYRGLLPHLLRGERLVFSPSYCVEEEAVRPLLLATRNIDGSQLSVPARTMADMILHHRHLSVRAKTVNQRFFSVDIIEQFYWAVDEHTLLARQFPVALVAMKPERHLKDLGCLWDYGVIADFCPSMKFVALSDSDDYLMLELRERDNPKGVIKLGWPTSDEIAARLGAIITDYTAELGRARFVVHSDDLSCDVHIYHKQLDAFVDDILGRLPSQLPSHHNHIQWTIHYAAFHEARIKFLAKQASIGEEAMLVAKHTDNTLTPSDAADKSHADSLARFNVSIAKLVEDSQWLPPKSAKLLAHTLTTTASFTELIRQFEHEHALLRARLYQEGASINSAAQFNIDVGKLGHFVNIMEQNGHEILGAAMQQFLAFNIEQSKKRVCDLCDQARLRYPPTTEVRPQATPLGTSEPKGMLKSLAHLLLGAPGNYRRWHWLHSPTIPARTFVLEYLTNQNKDVVLIYNAGPFVQISDSVNSLKLLPLILGTTSQLHQEMSSGRSFDCCIVNADISALKDFGTLYTLIRPRIRPGGIFLASFINPMLTDIQSWDIDAINRTFPQCGPARIVYSGSRASEIAFYIRNKLTQRLIKFFPAPLCAAMGIAFAAPFAFVASILESKRKLDDLTSLPSTITCVTIEIRIG